MAGNKKTPISEKIKKRLESAGARFNANDNIAEFINDSEIDLLQLEVEEKITEVLESLVIDIKNDHNTQETAKRVAKMYIKEVFAGRYKKMPPITQFPNINKFNELIIIGPIQIRSACSHHLCPIMGKAWIGVLPAKESELIGLSKYARLASWVFERPQIQEEAIVQLVELLSEKIKPQGVAVIMQADHFCMHWRGVKDHESKMINSAMRGSFLKDATLRQEFLNLVKL